MRRKIPILIMLGIMLITYAQAQDTLYVNNTAQQTTPFPLIEVNKLTFSEEDMLVHSIDGTQTPFAFSDISTLTFIRLFQNVPDTTAGIRNPVMLQNKGVSIYPNPVLNNVTIESAGNINQISIYDVRGALLLRKKQPGNKVTLSLSGAKSGVYLLRVDGVNGTSMHKIVKNKN